MEMLLIVLIVITVTVIVLGKCRNQTIPLEMTVPAPIPSKLHTMQEEISIRAAEFMEFDCFSLVIQPVVDFTTNAADSGEVLSRLNHPEWGAIFPDDFLPAIDAAGLYPQFDRYIFRKTCAWVKRSMATGTQVGCISCNFSRKTLSEANIAATLVQIADSYGIPHEKLAIEITEREQETDKDLFHLNLKLLKDAGFRMVLDDYGVGVTTASDLDDCPLDIVKLDRSILYAANTDEGKAAYKQLVDTAAARGLKVVCEGIETEEQHRFAKEVGCHYGQGFLFFRPVGADQVLEMKLKSRLAEEDV